MPASSLVLVVFFGFSVVYEVVKLDWDFAAVDWQGLIGVA